MNNNNSNNGNNGNRHNGHPPTPPQHSKQHFAKFLELSRQLGQLPDERSEEYENLLRLLAVEARNVYPLCANHIERFTVMSGLMTQLCAYVEFTPNRGRSLLFVVNSVLKELGPIPERTEEDVAVDAMIAAADIPYVTLPETVDGTTSSRPNLAQLFAPRAAASEDEEN